MAPVLLNTVDKVEILTLQDNYIDITAMDNNAVVTRAMPSKMVRSRCPSAPSTDFRPLSRQQPAIRRIHCCLTSVFPKTAPPATPQA